MAHCIPMCASLLYSFSLTLQIYDTTETDKVGQITQLEEYSQYTGATKTINFSMQTWLRWIEETLLVLGPADPSPLWTRATL
jgi:hypothetical protein